MPSREEMQSILDDATNISENAKRELRYDDLLHLADVFDGWALDSRVDPKRAAQLLGWADGYRNLADRLGPDWKPSYPEKLSLIGFIAKKLRET